MSSLCYTASSWRHLMFLNCQWLCCVCIRACMLHYGCSVNLVFFLTFTEVQLPGGLMTLALRLWFSKPLQSAQCRCSGLSMVSWSIPNWRVLAKGITPTNNFYVADVFLFMLVVRERLVYVHTINFLLRCCSLSFVPCQLVHTDVCSLLSCMLDVQGHVVYVIYAD